MSVTSVTTKNRYRLWMLAGGRCEYRGCNKQLWRNDKTLDEMNKAYIAHIVADSPKGPRGDLVRSPLLADDFSNLMLLCDEDHRTIDIVDVAGHPEERLLEFKRDHEQRIEMLTAIDPDLRTHMLTLVANIGPRKGIIDYRDAVQAVVPGRYPDARALQIDLTHLARSDDESAFWSHARDEVERQLDQLLPPASGILHVSVFGVAPIPVLMVFGRKLGDIREVDVFQKFRSEHPWKWREDGAQVWSTLEPKGASGAEVAVGVSVSGDVHSTEIETALGQKLPVYEFRVATPGLDVLATKAMLAEFRSAWRTLLTTLRSIHGESCRAHVFPAVPNSVAIEMGRTMLPKSNPTLEVWDRQQVGGFVHALTL